MLKAELIFITIFAQGTFSVRNASYNASYKFTQLKNNNKQKRHNAHDFCGHHR